MQRDVESKVTQRGGACVHGGVCVPGGECMSGGACVSFIFSVRGHDCEMKIMVSPQGIVHMLQDLGKQTDFLVCRYLCVRYVVQQFVFARK